jgi:ribosomal protein S12 methylthiotransferase
MPNQIPGKIKNARHRMAMSIQQKIAHEIARETVGREMKLLVDQPMIARTEADALDVDARVILGQPTPVGGFIWRRITGSLGYDLLA